MKREVDAEKLISHLSKRRDELAAEIRSLRAEQEHIEAFIDMFGLGIVSLTADGRFELTAAEWLPQEEDN